MECYVPLKNKKGRAYIIYYMCLEKWKKQKHIHVYMYYIKHVENHNIK